MGASGTRMAPPELSGVSDGFNVGLLIEPAGSRLAIPSEKVFDEDITRGRAVLP